MNQPIIDTRVSLTITGTSVSSGIHDDDLRYVQHAVETVDAVRKDLLSIHNARAAAQGDPTLNEAGALLKVAAFAEKAQERATRSIDASRKLLESAIASTEAELNAPLESAPTASTLPGEIRAHFRGLPSDKQHSLLLEAIGRNDVRVLSSVLGAPLFLSNIAEPIAKGFVQRYREAKNPGLNRRLKSLQIALERVDQIGSLTLLAVEDAIGSRWDKVQRVRKAKTEAERVFIVNAA